MAKKSAAMSLRPFVGRVSDSNPHGVPPGAAQLQKNMQCVRGGMLTGRGGMRPISFAATTTASTSNVIAVTRLDRPEATWVVYLLANGTLRAGRGVT